MVSSLKRCAYNYFVAEVWVHEWSIVSKDAPIIISQSKLSSELTLKKFYLSTHCHARATAEAWVQEWVVGLRLCPWATLTQGHSSKGTPYTRIVTLDGGEEQLDALAATVVREASVMRQVAQVISQTHCSVV